MDKREQIRQALIRLRASKSMEKITLADVARETSLSWHTVRRYIGTKRDIPSFMEDEKKPLSGEESKVRSAILTAAKKVYSDKGFHGASMDQIADEAGVSKSSIYWLFRTKQELYLALLKEDLKRQVLEMPNAIEDVSQQGDMEQTLYRFMLNQLNVYRTDPSRLRLFMEFISQPRDAFVQQRLDELYARRLDRLIEVVGRLKHAGFFKESLNPQHFIRTLTALIDGMSMAWMIDPNADSMEEWLRAAAKTMAHGM